MRKFTNLNADNTEATLSNEIENMTLADNQKSSNSSDKESGKVGDHRNWRKQR